MHIRTTDTALITHYTADSRFMSVNFTWWLMHMAPVGRANDNAASEYGTLMSWPGEQHD